MVPSAHSAALRSPARTGPRAGALRLATWNLAWLDAEEHSGVKKRAAMDYDRLRVYARRLDADVVALQEVEGPEAAARVFDAAEYAFHFTAGTKAQRTGFAYRKALRVTTNPDCAELAAGDLRAGADISVELGPSSLRLLAVHLKSLCFEAPLGDSSRHCTKLAAQLPVLEAWIDARARERVPFAVLGDFNRRFFARPDEEFWRQIDDGDPPDADLSSPTQGVTASCQGSRFPHFIDHIVLGRSAATLMKPGSFVEHLYESADKRYRRLLSDHCPLSVDLGAGNARDQILPPASASLPPAPSASAASVRAPIKGNINANRKKLYHLPSCPSYPDTKIELGRGERMFATEDEARAAGWVKARNCP